MTAVKTRTYHSPLRRRQASATRIRILESARALFVRQGYVATTIEQIASEADVSPRTVYLGFGSKSGLMWALREATLYSDETPSEGGVLPGLVSILQEPHPRKQLRAYARLARELHDRTWEVMEIEKA